MGGPPKIGGKPTPQIIHLFIGFSIIFTIHFGVPLFLGQHPYNKCVVEATGDRFLGIHPSNQGRMAIFGLPDIWVFPKIGVSQNGWLTMETPIKMDDLGVPLFLETPI